MVKALHLGSILALAAAILAASVNPYEGLLPHLCTLAHNPTQEGLDDFNDKLRDARFFYTKHDHTGDKVVEIEGLLGVNSLLGHHSFYVRLYSYENSTFFHPQLLYSGSLPPLAQALTWFSSDDALQTGDLTSETLPTEILDRIIEFSLRNSVTFFNAMKLTGRGWRRLALRIRRRLMVDDAAMAGRFLRVTWDLPRAKNILRHLVHPDVIGKNDNAKIVSNLLRLHLPLLDFARHNRLLGSLAEPRLTGEPEHLARQKAHLQQHAQELVGRVSLIFNRAVVVLLVLIGLKGAYSPDAAIVRIGLPTLVYGMFSVLAVLFCRATRTVARTYAVMGSERCVLEALRVTWFLAFILFILFCGILSSLSRMFLSDTGA